MPTVIRVHEVGGPEVMLAEDVPAPEPGEGELLVDVAAAGVNYLDTYIRSGLYPREAPFTLGQEGAGTVRAVGAGVHGFATGESVAWATAPGSYAEQAVVPARSAVAVPEGVSHETAAALMLQGITAHYLLTSTYPVRSGETVLVHASAGGVGLLLVQLASARGARVVATASTRDKRDLAAEAGADEVVAYDGFDERVSEFTGGEGVAAVYDGVGAATFDASLASLRRRGILVLFGAASGPVPPVDPQRLNTAGSVYLTRPTIGDYIADPDELAWRAGELFDAVRAGELEVRIGQRYSLSEARQAHADLEGRRTTGKLLLVP
jgi:NADPH2:quinone reductase